MDEVKLTPESDLCRCFEFLSILFIQLGDQKGIQLIKTVATYTKGSVQQ